MILTGNMVWLHTEPRFGGTVGSGKGVVCLPHLKLIVAMWEVSCLMRGGEFPGELGALQKEII